MKWAGWEYQKFSSLSYFISFSLPCYSVMFLLPLSLSYLTSALSTLKALPAYQCLVWYLNITMYGHYLIRKCTYPIMETRLQCRAFCNYHVNIQEHDDPTMIVPNIDLCGPHSGSFGLTPIIGSQNNFNVTTSTVLQLHTVHW